MRVLIVEDELPAREYLMRLVNEADPRIEIAGITGSVDETVAWLRSNSAPDLAFIDIHLSDGLAWDIFRRQPVEVPVVFTTSYDAYLLKSFEYRSIDYLLKPVDAEQVRRVLTKYAGLQQHFRERISDLAAEQRQSSPRERILVRKGSGYVALRLADVACFTVRDRMVTAVDFAGVQYAADESLREMEQLAADGRFFRANRQHLLNIDAVERFRTDRGGRLYVEVAGVDGTVEVSRDLATRFRAWLQR